MYDPHDDRDILTTYYAEAAAFPLLGPEREIALARRIEDLEIDVWERLLSYAPRRELVLQALMQGESDAPFDFRQLRRAVTLATSQRSVSARRRLQRSIRSTAGQIRLRDRDRTALGRVLAALEERPRKGVVFARHWAGVSEALDAAEKARMRFVSCNLRLVISVARRFRGRGLSLDDLIQEGNLGLMRAVDRFDYRQGYRFSTYATWWIRQAVGRAVQNSARTVRVPVHVQDTSRKIANAERLLRSRLQRNPTDVELAAELELPLAAIKTAKANSARDSAVSLDSGFGDDDDPSPWIERLVESAASPPEALEVACESEKRDKVAQLLGEVTPIQADILRKRFGIGGGNPMTLQEIASQYGITRERIRQIEGAALARLRQAADPEDRP